MSIRINTGDEARFKQLLDREFIRLKRFAAFFLKEEELSEEVVMDVFLRLWEKRDKIDDIDNLRAYLFVSVRNTCFNYLRKVQHEHSESLDDVEVKLARYESTPEDDLISEEMLDRLNSVVENLPPKCKIIFKLLREEGLSRKDTAKVLGISVNTIDNQVAVAVRKIGDALHLDLTLKRNFTGLRTFLLCF